MKTILTKLIKSIKVIYEEEKSMIKYEEYYFNMPIPKNIELKNISCHSIDI